MVDASSTVPVFKSLILLVVFDCAFSFRKIFSTENSDKLGMSPMMGTSFRIYLCDFLENDESPTKDAIFVCSSKILSSKDFPLLFSMMI